MISSLLTKPEKVEVKTLSVRFFLNLFNPDLTKQDLPATIGLPLQGFTVGLTIVFAPVLR